MQKTSYKFIIDNVQSRTEEWEGAKYLVVPVVAMVEGVHHGSGGAMFYPGDEIAKFTEAWNGRPVPVFHPTTLDGVPVSCNDPAIIAQQSVGYTFNFHYEDGKLKGEAWINIEKAQEIAPEILSIIQAHDRLEVSTGLFSDSDGGPGEWKGEAYDAVLRNFRPDHLALLPGGTGACSWEDGCGVRANQKGDNIMEPEEKRSKVKEFWTNLKKIFVTEDSHEDKRDALQQKVDALDNSNWFHYVRAVFNSYFVYQAQPSSPSAGRSSTLWKQSYTVKDNEVELTGEPTEVREEIKYKPVNNESVDNNSKGENDMTDKCCKEKIQLLIENEATSWDETDREWLKGLKEEQVDKLMPAEKSDIQKVVDNTLKDIQDGKLEVAIMRSFPLATAPGVGVRLFLKNIDKSVYLETYQCKSIIVKRKSPDVIHFDGEPGETGEVLNINVVPKGLNVFVN